MVEFGKTLAQSRRADWADSYLNYERLKAILKRANAVWKQSEEEGGTATATATATATTENANASTSTAQSTSHQGHRRSQSHSVVFTNNRNALTKSRSLRRLFSGGTSPSPVPTTFAEKQRQRQRHHQVLSLEFRRALDQEMEKVVLFSLELQGQLAHDLSHLEPRRQACLEHVARLWQDYNNSTTGTTTTTAGHSNNNGTSPPAVGELSHGSQSTRNGIRDTYQSYRRVAQDVLEYVSFIELNVTAVRKILKKHDKSPHNQAISKAYLSNRNSHNALHHHHHHHYPNQTMMVDDSHLDSLYGFDPGLSALMASLKRAFAELHQAECFTLLMIQSKLPLVLHNDDDVVDTSNSTTVPGGSFQKSHSAPLMSTAALPPHSSPPSTATIAKAFSLISATTARSFSYSSQDAEDPSRVMISLSTSDNDLVGEHGDNDEQQQQSSSLHYPQQKYSQEPTLARLASTANIQTQVTLAREPLLEEIHAARSRLHQSTKYVELVAAQAALFLDDDDAPRGDYDEDDDTIGDTANKDEKDVQRRRRKRLSRLINLASTFLYMTNYYIVAPTTGQYALRVGSSEAMAGIIIGMTPNAALIATVLYGVWSNYSYKSALLFAAVSSMAGNIAYAMALHYHSIELVMIGRFLNGFGSARSINRRFIADTFSRAERTAASADFVTAGALGMAAGPAIAVALGKLDDLGFGKGSGDSGSGGLFWNKLTAPGWVMLVLWSIFFVVAYWHFEEPDRSNLYGKKKSSQIEANNNTKNNETQRLLDTNTGEDMEVPQKKSSPLYRNVPVMMTLWIYFVLKLTLECLLSSSATLTSFYFGWGTKKTGAFLAFLGLLMFPANMGVARLSQQYQDRELILGTLMVMLVSVLGILSYSSGGYSVIQYMLFGICIFVSTNVLEGPNMSLLSKTIPKVWAKGTFNSGFLATEAGTAARSVGDVLISAAAAFRGVENLLNATFVPLLGLAAVSIWGTRICFDQMLEADEEDDDEEPDSVNDNRNETSAKSTH